MKVKPRIPIALTIAGSDSGGGAGIEADLKTFSALGVHGTVAVTSVTAQNTLRVTKIHDVPPDVVEAQIEAVVEDIGVDAAKTGMLSNSEIVKVVVKTVKKYKFPIVVDPVMYSKGGSELLKLEARSVLREKLIPIATVVTPNKSEAEEITGLKIESLEDAREAARYIVETLGAKAAVVKGGHLRLEGKAVDVLYYNGEFKLYQRPHVDSKTTHGTGCVFSAAITAELAKGKSIEEAIDTAKKFTYQAIVYGLNVGRGYGPVNPSSWVEIEAEKYRVIRNVMEALKVVEENGTLFSNYIPEVQMNVVMALPAKYAKSVEDVAGVLGRIVKVGDKVKPSGPVVFGASSHLARAVLKIMEYNPNLRSALNLKFREELVRKASNLGLTVSWYDRREEPEEIKRVEGATIPWGVSRAVERVGRAPDIIYHLGGWGKEAMINVFGRDAVDAVMKALRIILEVESSRKE